MIHRDLANGAEAMARTLRATPSALPHLVRKHERSQFDLYDRANVQQGLCYG